MPEYSGTVNAMPKKIGERLREEIANIPGGIVGVAKLVGKNRDTIYNWIEKGNIPATSLALLLEAGVDTYYVLTGQRATRESALSPPEAALVGKYRQMTEADRSRFQAIVHALVSAGDEEGEKVKKAG